MNNAQAFNNQRRNIINTAPPINSNNVVQNTNNSNSQISQPKPVQQVSNTPIENKSVQLISPIKTIPCPSKIQHEIEMYNTIVSFEKDAFNPDSKGFTTGFPELDKGLDKLQPGFHIIAGDSNQGKTSFMSQIAWQVSQLNNDVYVMDFSLDDALRDKIPRVIASSSNVIINSVKNPMNYSQYPEMIKRRNEGIKKLINSIDRYRIYDSSFSCFVEKIEEEIKRIKIELNANGINKRICVFIDNFHDLETSASEAKGSDKNKYDYLAKRIADMAIELDIPIICTAEFRKLNGFRRGSIDDLRESVKIKYEAKSILLIYNEVSVKGEAAQIYFTVKGKNIKQPVFEVKFGKNKFTSFKGRLFYYFFPDLALFKPVNATESKNFNNLLYSNS